MSTARVPSGSRPSATALVTSRSETTPVMALPSPTKTTKPMSAPVRGSTTSSEQRGLRAPRNTGGPISVDTAVEPALSIFVMEQVCSLQRVSARVRMPGSAVDGRIEKKLIPAPGRQDRGVVGSYEILTSWVWPGMSVLVWPVMSTVMGAPSARSTWTRATSVVNSRCNRRPR